MGKTVIKNEIKVIETGTQIVTYGTWTYRKWSDGTAECWGKFVRTNCSWSSWGGVYDAGNMTVTYPTDLFIEVPRLSINVYCGAGDAIPELATPGKTNTGAIYAVRPIATATSSVSADIYAIGKWR